MATDISICSNALLALGANPISSFSEGDDTNSGLDRARLCSNLYPDVRAACLRGGNWACATTRVILSPDLTPPVFGPYAYRYQLPGDWMRTQSVGQSDLDNPDYRTESGYILCDDTPLYLVYTWNNTLEATYDAALVLALEAGMMAALAYPITKDQGVVNTTAQRFEALLDRARVLDAQDSPPQTFGDFPLLRSRLAGFGGRRL